MLQSKLFTRTLREGPKDETSINAQLLVRGGFIHKEMAGVYSFLPLGLKVVNKVAEIVRAEMNKIGGVEVLLTALQDSNLWQKTGRWDDQVVDNWFKTKLTNGVELGLASTHEEPITSLVAQHLSSYRDLPLYLYQFQTKFRNELRSKGGLLRTREFLMKDLYSFSRNEKEFKEFYEKCAQAYFNIFERVGLKDYVFRTFASGGSFSQFSDEFQALSPSGEDIIYLDRKKKIAINKEVYNDEVLAQLKLNKSELEEVKAIEVANIFPLGIKYSKPLNLKFKDEKGEERLVVMGCYGIGISRLVGTIVEINHDQKGIIWPKEVSPFSYHLIKIENNSRINKIGEKIYQGLLERGIEVLYDERENKSVGEKFAEADLIGLPWRVVLSEQTLEKDCLEVKRRSEGKTRLIKIKDIEKCLD